jgi:hypothetical protein
VVRHTGYTDPAMREKKSDRELAIPRTELKGRPHDPFVLFNLGWITSQRGKWTEADDSAMRFAGGLLICRSARLMRLRNRGRF